MPELKRALGFFALLFLGVGVIVGAGIYSVIGAAAGEARELLWLSFVLAAIPAGLTALCYAELVAMIPKVGAEYTFLREAFPRQDWVPFATGFVVVLVNCATSGTVALAFAGYLGQLVSVPGWAGALGLLGACTLLNCLGIRESAAVAVALAGVELAGLALVVFAGVESGRFAAGAGAPLHAGVFSGAALIFFVYTGFEGIVNLAEEARDPRRDLPRALLASGAVTLVCYLAVAFAVLGLASPAALAASESPLATALAGQPALAAAVSVIALFSTGNTALVTLVVASRVLLGMARAGDMPRALARISARRRSPGLAAGVAFVAAAALVPLGDVALASSVSSLATLGMFSAVAIAVIALRVREPARERPFRIPGSIGRIPFVPVLAIASAAALASQFRAATFAILAGTLLFGFVLGRARRRSR